MNRPTITADLIERVASSIIREVGVDSKKIAIAYSVHFDGYDLARELEQYHYVPALSLNQVRRLNRLISLVNEEFQFVETEWVIKNNIQPKLNKGTILKRGVIEGVCEDLSARYKVKEHGCTKEGRYLLVKFEDAERELGLL